MSVLPKPAATIELELELVRALLRAQQPQLAQLELRVVESGWDNHIVRCGDALALRLPRRELGVELLRVEQRWLPRLAPHLAIATPAPIYCGRPQAEFPWPWSVVPWIEGEIVGAGLLPAAQAPVLGRTLAQLHAFWPVSEEWLPHNPFRGQPLTKASERMAERLARLSRAGACSASQLAVLQAEWSRASSAALEPEAQRWIHGDLHPRNVLVRAGELAALLDWGDTCVGDRSTDLAAAWLLLAPEHRGALWAAYGEVSPATLQRARGWALYFGSVLLEAGLGGDAIFAAVGRRVLDELAAGA